MGLDSYLKATRYVGGWRFEHEEQQKQFKDILKAAGVPEGIVTDKSPSLEITINVAYWRKANAIHRWFVENVQDGEDECKTTDVEREQLQSLVDICERVIGGESPAASLPTQSGFFFGTTDYGKDYMEDLKHTVDQIKPLLANPVLKDWTFQYRSSW